MSVLYWKNKYIYFCSLSNSYEQKCKFNVICVFVFWANYQKISTEVVQYPK